jgi:hypothetical protein
MDLRNVSRVTLSVMELKRFKTEAEKALHLCYLFTEHPQIALPSSADWNHFTLTVTNVK